MDINFEDKSGGTTPSTRMYAPGTKAGAKKGDGPRKKSGRADREAAFAVDEEGYKIRIPTSQVKRSSRIGIIISGFLFAGMVLFTLSGYERISRAYADVNTLNDEIDQTNLRIVGLNVEIECAVTIQQAQDAAKRFNMVFPDTSDSTHYQKVGGEIKFPDEVLYPALTADTGTDTADTADTTQNVGDGQQNDAEGNQEDVVQPPDDTGNDLQQGGGVPQEG